MRNEGGIIATSFSVSACKTGEERLPAAVSSVSGSFYSRQSSSRLDPGRKERMYIFLKGMKRG